jgi:hypothetical protein
MGDRAKLEPVKVVIRYADGRLIKGYTNGSFPKKDTFHLRPVGSTGRDGEVEISVRELKAIFLVKDFLGNPAYREKKHFTERQHPPGRRVEVTFMDDNELLVGSTVDYDPQRPGFFVTPADPQSNNLTVFVVTASMSKFRYL